MQFLEKRFLVLSARPGTLEKSARLSLKLGNEGMLAVMFLFFFRKLSPLQRKHHAALSLVLSYPETPHLVLRGDFVLSDPIKPVWIQTFY